MSEGEGLREALLELEGRSYGDYRRLARRSWRVAPFVIAIEYVQGDPFAAPSRVRIDVPPEVSGLPAPALATENARRATADFLHRAILRELDAERARGRGSGSGGSGRIEIVPVGQEVLARSAVAVAPDGVLGIRLTVGLPAAGRRILGRAAAELLVESLPRVLAASIGRTDLVRLGRHIEVVEDQSVLRAALPARGLIAFLAEGAVLPRASGVDDRPLGDALPLEVPPALAVELDAPHAGRLRGLGIPAGVTLIAGGGYHGKSTLLDAIARSVYDHIPGDGRELCVTHADAVCIRAEDGRAVHGVDLRPFIHDLPLGRPAAPFDTEDASGSTSQAAAIVEALEAGARALLIDEDTAATNFMIRDARMRRLVPVGREPITPFIDRVRQLHDVLGVSSVLVVGGAGDYLDVADLVILMDSYRPHDATAAASDIARALPIGKEAWPTPPGAWPEIGPRTPLPASFDPSRGRRAERVRSRSTRAIEFGTEEIDVSLVAQLVDPSQCRLIGDLLLALSRGLCDGRASLAAILDRIEEQLATRGVEGVAEPTFGDRASVRRHELAAAINRLRSLKVAAPDPAKTRGA